MKIPHVVPLKRGKIAEISVVDSVLKPTERNFKEKKRWRCGGDQWGNVNEKRTENRLRREELNSQERYSKEQLTQLHCQNNQNDRFIIFFV